MCVEICEIIPTSAFCVCARRCAGAGTQPSSPHPIHHVLAVYNMSKSITQTNKNHGICCGRFAATVHYHNNNCIKNIKINFNTQISLGVWWNGRLSLFAVCNWNKSLARHDSSSGCAIFMTFMPIVRLDSSACSYVTSGSNVYIFPYSLLIVCKSNQFHSIENETQRLHTKKTNNNCETTNRNLSNVLI